MIAEAIGMGVAAIANLGTGIANAISGTSMKKEETKQLQDNNRTAVRIAQLQIELQTTVDAGQRMLIREEVKKLQAKYDAELAKMEAENAFTGNKLLLAGGFVVLVLVFGIVFIKDDKE